MVAIQDVLILLAVKNDTLKITEEFSSRFQESYWNVSDEDGVIETFLKEDDMKEYFQRLQLKLM